MKRTGLVCVWLMCLILVFPAFAIEVKEYTWEGYTITVVDVRDEKMIVPWNMEADQRAIAVQMDIPEPLTQDETLLNKMYEAAALFDSEGKMYLKSVAMEKRKSAILKSAILFYAIPKEMKTEELHLVFREKVEDSAPPKRYTLDDFLGDWSIGDQTFTFMGDVTWQYTKDDVTDMLKGELIQEFLPGEDLFILFRQGTLHMDLGVIHDQGFICRKNSLVGIANSVTMDSKASSEVYDILVEGLSYKYGAPNVQAFDEVGKCLKALSVGAEELLEIEKSPWSAWLLPDQQTLVLTSSYKNNLLLFINKTALQN